MRLTIPVLMLFGALICGTAIAAEISNCDQIDQPLGKRDCEITKSFNNIHWASIETGYKEKLISSLQEVFALPVAILLVSGACSSVFLFSNKNIGMSRQLFWISLSLSIAGIVIGLITGATQLPLLRVVIIPVLAAIVCVALYIIRTDRETRQIVCIGIFAVFTGILFGTILGSNIRKEHEGWRNSGQYRWNMILDNAVLIKRMEQLNIPHEAYVGPSISMESDENKLFWSEPSHAFSKE